MTHSAMRTHINSRAPAMATCPAIIRSPATIRCHTACLVMACHLPTLRAMVDTTATLDIVIVATVVTVAKFFLETWTTHQDKLICASRVTIQRPISRVDRWKTPSTAGGTTTATSLSCSRSTSCILTRT